ncbi:MAG: transglutaminase [Robiginitomaculum sp.]|nr:MAG: transglutaminase [Robiginitomaculum sp.]
MKTHFSPNLCDKTFLLDYNADNIQSLIGVRDWSALNEYDRIGAVYDFVRDEILFGYNIQDALPASHILKDGYGQCNTKAILLMALFRALNIACRLHGFTIKKELQRGVIPELIYPITPDNIIHSWVEIHYDDQWINLEGFILDRTYLSGLQNKFKGTTSLCGYGVGTNTLTSPDIYWRAKDTYIQKTGINNDYGVFNTPDSFYKQYSQDLTPVKSFLYRTFLRHWMNARVAKIRKKQLK